VDRSFSLEYIVLKEEVQRVFEVFFTRISASMEVLCVSNSSIDIAYLPAAMPTLVRLEIRLLVLSVVGAVVVPDRYMKGTQLLRSKVELAPSNLIAS
jgi:hypothetical protein